MRKALVAAGWAWAAAIVWLSLTPSLPKLGTGHADKFGHFAAYGVLMFWFAQLYRQRLAYAAGFFAMGVALEFLQQALGSRQFDVFDMLANTLGVATGWGVARMLQSRV